MPFKNICQRLTGATVSALGRRAKYGLIETDRGDTMIFHLGMSGRWRIDPEELGTHDHLIVGVDRGHILSLNDPRRFGSVDLVPTADIDAWPPFAAHMQAEALHGLEELPREWAEDVCEEEFEGGDVGLESC